MSRVRCKGPARRCKADLLLDGMLERRGARRIRPSLDVRLRAPGGRVTERTFQLPAQSASGGGCSCRCRCRRRCCGRPTHPSSTAPRSRSGTAAASRSASGADRPALGRGEGRAPVAEQPPHPAARRVDPRGHAGLGRGAHRRRHGPDRGRPEGPRRQHHPRPLPPQPRLLDRLDRAGIMVWSQAPIWQRDSARGVNLLADPSSSRGRS